MFFRSRGESEALASALGHSKEFLESIAKTESYAGSLVVDVGEAYHRAYWMSKALRRWFSRSEGWLLWITEFGIWKSRENEHLMHRLRLSYGERGDWTDLPGHQFLAYQAADVETFLLLALLFGWGGYFLAIGGPGIAFISHDGWVRVVLDEWFRSEVVAEIEQLKDGYRLE